MTKTLDDFTQEQIEQAKMELEQVLMFFVAPEDLKLSPTQVLNFLIRKEQKDDKA
jgi:hypothetical protein